MKRDCTFSLSLDVLKYKLMRSFLETYILKDNLSANPCDFKSVAIACDVEQNSCPICHQLKEIRVELP